MKIGIVGSGRIGAALARLFVRAGYEVSIANSRGPASLEGLVRELGDTARAATPAQAAADADIVVLAVPFRGRDAVLPALDVRGKIVVDAMNPYTESMEIIDLHGRRSSEVVAAELPGARLVKAFNTMYFETLASGARPRGADRLVMPISGDDAEAVRVVAAIIDAIGFEPLVMGSLKESARQEPGAPIYNRPLTLEQARTVIAG